MIDDINFTVEPGSFVCLLGPSGCGKPTVLNSIAGFINPSDGAILVALDAQTRHMMQKLLMEIWQDFKTTVIFSFL